MNRINQMREQIEKEYQENITRINNAGIKVQQGFDDNNGLIDYIEINDVIKLLDEIKSLKGEC